LYIGGNGVNHFKGLIFITLLGTVIIQGCQSGIPTTIIASKTVMYERPDSRSSQIATLTYGQRVLAFPKTPSRIVNEWTKIRLEKKGTGFVKSPTLGTPEIIERIQSLKKSIEEIEPQATGVTTAPTFLRLEPGRDGTPVEKLPTGTHFEMFERQATYRFKPTSKFSAQRKDKDVWYKVRLADGRVGYIFTSNFNLEPPPELSMYTHFRRPMAWLKLRSKTGSEGETVYDYVVAYATPGVDFGADFDRLEIYYWDGSQYQTAFVTSSLKGILPIKLVRKAEKIFYEFAEIDPEHEHQVIVSRYPVVYPYKVMSRTALAKEVGLH
jgi:hypothetical protein